MKDGRKISQLYVAQQHNYYHILFDQHKTEKLTTQKESLLFNSFGAIAVFVFSRLKIIFITHF
jgi:hypothetical protein